MIDLLEHETSMMDERPTGGCRADAAPASLEQWDAGEMLHLADTLAGGGKRQVGLFGAVRDAGRFGDMQEKL
jgi:hypothetical protein